MEEAKAVRMRKRKRAEKKISSPEVEKRIPHLIYHKPSDSVDKSVAGYYQEKATRNVGCALHDREKQ